MDEESHFPFSIIFQLRRSENRQNAVSPAYFCVILPASQVRTWVVGIELGAPVYRWRVTILALSVCEVGAQFHPGHVSRGPPIIPDGRISRGPVWNLGLSSMSLPRRREV